MYFREWLLINEGATFYHGTPIGSLKDVLSQGLKIDKRSRWTQSHAINAAIKSNYLSPDVERAVRYAVGMDFSDTPAVLELDISMTPKRMKKLAYDPMDRSEDAWDWEDYKWESEEGMLERDLEEFLSKSVGRHVSLDFEDVDVIKLDGFDLYKFLLQEIKKYDPNFQSRRSVHLKTIQEHFPPGMKISDSISITPSGTLRIDPRGALTQSQYQYGKSIPPSAIKAVWVRKKDFPNIKGEERDLGIDLLPHELKDNLEEIDLLIDIMLGYSYSKDDSIDDLPDMEPEDAIGVIDEWLERLDDVTSSFVDEDLIIILKEIKELLKQGEDIKEIVKQAREIIENHRDVGMEIWGQDKQIHHEPWIRLDKNDPQLRMVIR